MKTEKKLLVLGIILISFNLRTPLTAVGPLINNMRNDLGISNSMSGFLTTLPLLVFAVLSPISAKIGNKVGEERTIFTGFIILITGIILRSLGGIEALFLGTILIGMGIVTGNVLIPSIIKKKFPQKIGLMTSTFSASMSLSAGIASGISVPISNNLGFGWRYSLLIWSILTCIAILFWIPQLKNSKKHGNTIKIDSDVSDEKSIWTSVLAWKVALFMGLQSFLFYCFVAWLPAILSSRGLSMEAAGWLLSFFQIVALPTSFIAPIVAERVKDQRGIVAASCIIYFVGMLGLMVSESMIALTLSVILMAIAGGACLSLAFTFIGLRSSNNRQASELSGMSQAVGYLLAAVGPILIGFLFDITKTWTYSIILMLIIALLLLYFGLSAGQNKRIFQIDTLLDD